MRVVAFLTACGISAASAAVAMAAGPPVVSAGPVVGPSGTATASGTVASGGQTDACVNDQHSGASPSGSDTSGAAQVNDRGCAAGSQPGGGSPGGGQASGSRSGASASGAQAGGGRAQTASVGGARARTSIVMAAQAVGLRIASIRFSTACSHSTRRLGVQVAEDDRLAGSGELWADEDFAPPKLQPVFVPRPDSVAFGRGFLLAAAVSLVLWLAAAAICFAAYRLIA